LKIVAKPIPKAIVMGIRKRVSSAFGANLVILLGLDA